MNVEVKEFSVCGEKFGSLFAHRWYIGVDGEVDNDEFKTRLDNSLKLLNDDYAVERSAALKEIFVEMIPIHLFYDWMKTQGKTGGQNKFPRVLNEHKLESWNDFLTESQSAK